MTTDFGVLGTVQVRHGEAHVVIGAAMVRRLLAVLLCRPGRAVAVPTLIEALWGDAPPRGSHKTVQVYVRRLRQLIGEQGRIAYGPGGYAVVVAPGELDALRFAELTADARAAVERGSLEAARVLFRQGLALWRGPAFDDIEEPLLVAAEARRLEEEHLRVHEDCAAVTLALGRHDEVSAELAPLAALHPYRERLCAFLMLALCHTGRRAEALEIYHRTSTALREELGVAPGRLLTSVHEAVLDDGAVTLPGETLPAVRHTFGADPVSPHFLPPDLADFAGRQEQAEALRRALAAGAAMAVVVGGAGTGKTALAVHVAHRLREQFPDGQLYAELGGSGDRPVAPGRVLGRFLVPLGADCRTLPATQEERQEAYRALTAARRVLVILDDAASEAQVRPLIPSGPHCAVLVTSRRRLAALSARPTMRLSVLDPAAARELFARVAGEPGADEWAAAEIVRLCDRLPLALRIAGARVAGDEHLSLTRLASRLRAEPSRLDELTAGDLSVRDRLRSSYAALGEPTRRAYRLLGLLDVPDFASWVPAALLDVSLEEAEALTEELLDVHLLDCTGADACGRPRYRLSDLVRLHARERAAAEEPPEPRAGAVRRAIGGWLALAEAADRSLPERLTWDIGGVAARWYMTPARARGLVLDALDWFDVERAAIRACVAQAAASGQHELAWELAARSVNYYAARGLHEDWADTHERALRACRHADNLWGEEIMARNLATLRTARLTAEL
ncbi:AfsR/SARP family transcriptional regulator [Acrocarpospora macrocephala]|uniref:AfsR/SARP family transcriptional regulator n=1 Tax=Acrocarpospora macrocephala TaxID=150177 RepID=UPI0012D3173D|nr:AfsR/SARP family transcriptional regulator [Acrocarpospora macrocephala]